MRLTCHWSSLKVWLALRWAGRYLGIKRRGFARAFVLDHPFPLGTKAALLTRSKRIAFGIDPPSLLVILHEAVHAQQDERGYEWPASRMTALYAREPTPDDGTARVAWLTEHNAQPHEVEANQRAAEMVRAAPWWLRALW